VDDAPWHTWSSDSGDQKLPVPDRYTVLGVIKISVRAKPPGTQADIEVWWDDRKLKELNFENFQEREISQSDSPGND
jgi:hypothetical protein